MKLLKIIKSSDFHFRHVHCHAWREIREIFVALFRMPRSDRKRIRITLSIGVEASSHAVHRWSSQASVPRFLGIREYPWFIDAQRASCIFVVQKCTRSGISMVLHRSLDDQTSQPFATAIR